jgi:hypothetical protein
MENNHYIREQYQHPLSIAKRAESGQLTVDDVQHATMEELQQKYLGFSVFTLAIRQCPCEIVEAMINCGIDINVENTRPEVLAIGGLISIAIEKYRWETVKFLIHKGADVTCCHENDGWTPLHYAATYDTPLDIIQTLVQAGAVINCKTYRENRTPFDCARLGRNFDIALCLVEMELKLLRIELNSITPMCKSASFVV